MIRKFALLAAFFVVASAEDCNSGDSSAADTKQRQQQEVINAEATSAVGMPAIHNFRERRQLKDIFEMRDQDGLVTYTYLFAEMTGKLTFFCNSIGFGISSATQFTNPQRPIGDNYHALATIPQADPNGLFSPASAEGTWVTCVGPDKRQHPVYVEPRVVVSPFKLEP